MKILLNTPFPNDILDVVRLFFPNEVFFEIESRDACGLFFNTEVCGGKENYSCSFNDTVAVKSVEINPSWNMQEKIRFTKRAAKLCVYECLRAATGINMPWGSLTGIRPVKLARELCESGLDARKTFTEEFFVSEKKTELISRVLKSQKGFINTNSKKVDFFVNIPFCVTRCSYCSFVTGDIKSCTHLIEPYIGTILKEIKRAKEIVNGQGFEISSVYVGGGTPTALSVLQLEKVLSALDFKVSEFTVEAGRPDTINKEKLELFKNMSVTRISVNPQTFNQRTLDLIERKHTISEIVSNFELGKRFGFDINMDLIAGLPGEHFEDFSFSLNETLKLRPENVTVHTLALKAGSKLKEQGCASVSESEVEKMINYAEESLAVSEYNPYYLYRQKYMAGNLENVGYCLKGKQCGYNIDIMEENTSIIACGANAISKKVYLNENRIERAANVKDLVSYISRVDEMIERKEKLFLP